MKAIKKSTVAAGAMIISGGMLLSRLLGFVRENMLMNAFGDSDVTGAYNSAFMVPDLLYYLLAGGAMSAAFIPVFTNYLAKGEEEDAHITGSTIATALMVVMLFGSLLEFIFAPYIVRMIAPGYAWGSDVFNMTVTLTRIMCIMVLFTAQSGLLTGILNSYHHFLAPTLVWNAYNICIILGIAVFSKMPWRDGLLNIPADQHGALGIHGVAFSVVLGAFLMMAIQFPVAVKKYGFKFRFLLDFKHPGVIKVLKLFGPVMLGLSLTQINLLAIPLIIGSLLGAPAVTDIRLANRLVLLPFGLFAVAIATAIFPRFSQQVAMNEMAAFRALIARSVNTIMILIVPSIILMVVLAEPINYALWGGGKFDESGLRATSFVLMLFAWNLVGLSLQQIVSRAFYSMHDTITPVIAGITMVAVNVPLSIFLVYTPLRYGGAAVATTLTTLLSTVVLTDLLRRRLGGINGSKILITNAKILAASLLMGVVVYFVAVYLAPVINNESIGPAFRWSAPSLPFTKPEVITELKIGHAERIKLLLSVAISSGIGMAVYFTAIKLLKVEELQDVAGRFFKRFRKKIPTDMAV
ncbi:MAG: murein biosynthesis integral membrane protein MurJ [bacterium]